MAWQLLLTSDIGLLSLFTILFMVGMAIYIFAYVMHRVKDADRKACDTAATRHMPQAH